MSMIEIREAITTAVERGVSTRPLSTLVLHLSGSLSRGFTIAFWVMAGILVASIPLIFMVPSGKAESAREVPSSGRAPASGVDNLAGRFIARDSGVEFDSQPRIWWWDVGRSGSISGMRFRGFPDGDGVEGVACRSKVLLEVLEDGACDVL